MALEIKLSQKLSQTLVMTPQLQQAIKLLQLGRMDYLEVVQKELLENPLLEDLADTVNETISAGQRQAEAQAAPAAGGHEAGERDAAEAHRDQDGDTSAQEQDKTTQWLNYLDLYAEAYSPASGHARRDSTDDERPSFEATVSKPEGLFSHLLWQLRTSDLSDAERDVGVRIIGNLDKDGYFGCSLEEVAAECRCEPGQVEAVLRVVQSFDPPGIAARDLRECLSLQLEQLGLGGSLAALIVDKHLSKLEIRRYDVIAKEEGVAVEDVYEALRQVQKLEPRPGRPYVDEAPIYITPDLYIRKIGDEWILALNEAGMPRLRLSPRYRDFLENGKGANSAEREYLQEKFRSATWLLKSIHQRQQTIYRVAESIMKFQQEFLEGGVSAMRPLVLRDIAADVSMHESTVSRVTTNKYIHTPHGVFELKFFFSSGLRTEQGEVSSESVKERIRELVAAEDSARPLSDQAIVKQLRTEGIDIARRTVAKYREMMNILSSSRRKKVF